VKSGFAISILLHVALLVWAMIEITNPRDFKRNEIKTVSVNLTTVDELTRVKAGQKKAKKKPVAPLKPVKPKPKPKVKAKPKPKKVKKAAVLPPKPKELAAKPKPKPKKAKAKPKPKKVVKKVALKKKVVRKKKPVRKKPKKKTFDPDKISALLNKLPNAQPQANKPAPTAVKKPPAKPINADRGRVDGLDARMSVNEIDAFRAQISRCWNPPVGGLGADRMVVRMRIQLKEDGGLANPPRLMNSQSSPFFAAASDAALRAVWQCQPYDMPKQKYAVWRDMILNFDPREMF